jgi:mannose-6-phosphate isomerase-like protein (cupin superfamily)
MALLGAGPALAAPAAATIITHGDLEKVLQLGPKATDHTVAVVDMGQNYQMSIGVVHRGPTGAPRPAAAGGPGSQTATTQEACGLASAPAGAPVANVGMLAHASTAETYVVIAGSGTLVTGGQILDGRKSPAESDVVKILNGPTCNGKVAGDFVSTKMNVGDIAVIPAGVPHGWSEIPTEVTYLSVRPDPEHVLPKAPYTYPGLRQ